MLTPAQRQELKGLAHPLKPVVLVGDKGLAPAVYAEIDRALRVHELMKVRVDGEDREERGAAMASICKELNADAVQIIGKTLVIYRAMTQVEREAKVAKQVERKQRRIKADRRSELDKREAEIAARPRVAARPMRVGTKRSRLADSPIRGQDRGDDREQAPRRAFSDEPYRAPPRPSFRDNERTGARTNDRPPARSPARPPSGAPARESRFGNSAPRDASDFGGQADRRRAKIRDEELSADPRNIGGTKPPARTFAARPPANRTAAPRTSAPRTSAPRTSAPRTSGTRSRTK